VAPEYQIDHKNLDEISNFPLNFKFLYRLLFVFENISVYIILFWEVLSGVRLFSLFVLFCFV
jgi:hypothetical protein